MTDALVFVHGTGVRRDRFEKFLKRIRRRWAAVSSAPVHPCYWGDDHGSVLHRGASLRGPVTSASPPPMTAAGADAGAQTGTADVGTDVWEQLEQDPWLELLALADASTLRSWLDRAVDGERLTALLVALPQDEVLRAMLREEDLDEVLEPAVKTLADSEPWRRATGADPLHPEIRPVAARALLATVLALADDFCGEPVALGAAERDALERHVVGLLGGSHRSWVSTGVLKALTYTRLSRPWDRFVGGVPDGGSALAGDVMVFLTRGNGMRSAVAEAVETAVREAAAGRDGTTELRVTVVGHSLGGVAAVDLLARGPVPGVDTLVTVGSQAPYLYELDVLPALRYGQALPDTFPRWVNVYDPRDALAFRAEGVFPGTPAGRVRDVMLDSHVPFPRAHSAYFSHRGLYRLLAGIDRPDRPDRLDG